MQNTECITDSSVTTHDDVLSPTNFCFSSKEKEHVSERLHNPFSHAVLESDHKQRGIKQMWHPDESDQGDFKDIGTTTLAKSK